MFLLAMNWWSLALRGVIAILLGLLTFTWPGITLSAFVLLFGAYAFIDGIVNLAGAVQHSRMHERWGALLVEGILGIVAGIVTFAWPGVTLLILIIIIAVWAVMTGVFEIAAAIRLRKHISGEWLLIVTGVASVLFGILLFAAPATGALVIALWFGVYAIVFGILLTALAFRLRSWHKRHGTLAAPRPAV
ncbi:MAG: HdeD family acid-resistance protein [Acidobacteriaceae bacterium]|nr:HdeD family acid-resistance protein [Acidobacteriaceae bacterium]